MLPNGLTGLLRIVVHDGLADHDTGGITHLLQMPDDAEDVQMATGPDIEVRNEPQQGARLGLTRLGRQDIRQGKVVVAKDIHIPPWALAQATHHRTQGGKNAFFARHFFHTPDLLGQIQRHGQTAPARCNCSSRDTERSSQAGKRSWRVPRYCPETLAISMKPM